MAGQLTVPFRPMARAHRTGGAPSSFPQRTPSSSILFVHWLLMCSILASALWVFAGSLSD